MGLESGGTNAVFYAHVGLNHSPLAGQPPRGLRMTEIYMELARLIACPQISDIFTSDV